ncbi:hypothetical protein CMI37_13895 [Candidatus Pacearchaeota archaeon]|nr:hypothetical protein [Candidatus Pacearchaeota archaeon]|tara:strand:- start:819 stop:1229 length:411 start_codon:yes stop_codon:yes gene_type:complete
MTIEAAATGLHARLETISALKKVYDAKELPNSIPVFPSAIILMGTTDYYKTFTNKLDVVFRVIIVVGGVDNPAAANELLDFKEISGDDSVVAAVEGDSTLGGNADDAVVKSNSGLGTTQWGRHNLISTEFEVICYV